VRLLFAQIGSPSRRTHVGAFARKSPVGFPLELFRPGNLFDRLADTPVKRSSAMRRLKTLSFRHRAPWGADRRNNPGRHQCCPTGIAGIVGEPEIVASGARSVSTDLVYVAVKSAPQKQRLCTVDTSMLVRVSGSSTSNATLPLSASRRSRSATDASLSISGTCLLRREELRSAMRFGVLVAPSSSLFRRRNSFDPMPPDEAV
jgi:hypothetical protein